jgi:hypothetical protein
MLIIVFKASNTYLPGSTKQIQCHQEMMMLCWKFLETNKVSII